MADSLTQYLVYVDIFLENKWYPGIVLLPAVDYIESIFAVG